MDRKVTVCVSMKSETIAAVEAEGPKSIKSTSGKMEWIIQQWLSGRNTLVSYQNTQQRECGEPERLELGALRVAAWAPYLKGWDSGAPAAVQEKFKRIRKGTITDIEQEMRAQGFRTQLVVDPEGDITELWAAKADTAGCQAQCVYRKAVDRLILEVRR